MPAEYTWSVHRPPLSRPLRSTYQNKKNLNEKGKKKKNEKNLSWSTSRWPWNSTLTLNRRWKKKLASRCTVQPFIYFSSPSTLLSVWFFVSLGTWGSYINVRRREHCIRFGVSSSLCLCHPPSTRTACFSAASTALPLREHIFIWRKPVRFDIIR